ncbi:5-formyltetrahydrofolate cyclo-ligase [Sansalvadorimonas sp. 2012CJ34-2]|uniref:5-formyltetrahydrofolate cyclo-ligase n=1 Tax=Parendozoicomonas callyspongiae TaxID=2942213 RepID=A0ABT0PD34_9GAMM|nr:5-formyltetrahydrofolate cyclo-ligase [Sansalvadorimonas sp. 2012CJ34-2]MCL6269245.1 5-formyltetrahydrofolate cyclo-ligase [Sansalvadorimonas sp. 2012CJ34-2]
MTSESQNDELQQQKKQLRQQLRDNRRSLNKDQQKAASQKLLETITSHDFYIDSQHIAVYLARDGEIDPQLIVEDAWAKGKQVYLPVIDKSDWSMLFMPWSEDSVMVDNYYGIPEPDPKLYQPVAAKELDLVLLPLTGFDEQGNRMGMGGGYYDRAFEFVGEQTQPTKPVLIGLAHECQKVEQIPTGHWDIPLTGIATNSALYK